MIAINWGQILSDLGVFGLVVGGITWLLKVLGQHFMDKRFKAYEKELDIKSQEYQAKLDTNLESHKAELNIQHTQYLKLHEKRLEIVAELYGKLSELDMEMRVLTSPMKPLPQNQTAEEQDNEHIESSKSAYIKFREFYNKNKIFFSENDCSLVDDLILKYTSALLDGSSRYRLGKSNADFNFQNFLKAVETVHTHIPPIMQSLEKEFRNTLGVK